MAVTYDNAGTNEGNSTNPNASITIAGANRFALIGLKVQNGPTISAATIGGNAMTLVAQQDDLYVYRYINPGTGAQAISFTISGANDWVVGAVSFNGVDQTTPIGTPAQITNTLQTSISQSVTGTADGMIVDTAFMVNDTMAAAAGQTERVSRDSFGSLFASFGMSTKPGSAGSVTMQWDALATFGDNALIVVPLLAAAGAAGASVGWLKA